MRQFRGVEGVHVRRALHQQHIYTFSVKGILPLRMWDTVFKWTRSYHILGTSLCSVSIRLLLKFPFAIYAIEAMQFKYALSP